MADFITPKGMRDYCASDAILREQIVDTIKDVYKKWGYQPLFTPAIEMKNTLGAKSGDEIAGQLFKIEDSEYALRFDLTIGTARFASNTNMPKPYKRYCIAPVWRREEPQKGRLREFLQADADIIGSKDMRCEAELLSMACEALEALGFKEFEVLLNNRKILNGLLKKLGIEQKQGAVLRALDKMEKVGRDKTIDELINAKISKGLIDEIISWIEFEGTNEQKLQKAREYSQEGADELNTILCILKYAYKLENVKIDLSLVRGLGYYTGPIFEIKAGGGVGSISGGGRYDDLLGIYGKSESAVGISLGVERIFTLMQKNKLNDNKKVMIVSTDNEAYAQAINIAKKLRENGVCTFTDLNDRKIAAQIKYASSVDVNYVIIVGKKEIESSIYTFKNLQNSEQKQLDIEQILLELNK